MTKIPKNLPAILTGVSSVATLATGLLAIEGYKRSDNNPEYSTKEYIRTNWKHYIPASLSALLSMGSSIASHRLNVKEQMILLSGMAFLNKSYSDYRDSVREAADPEVYNLAQDIFYSKQSNDNDILWKESITGHFFRAKEIDVIKSEFILDRLFVSNGYAKLNDFFDMLRIDRYDRDELGWSVEYGDLFGGYEWINFVHEDHVTEEGEPYKEILYSKGPETLDFLFEKGELDYE